MTRIRVYCDKSLLDHNDMTTCKACHGGGVLTLASDPTTFVHACEYGINVMTFSYLLKLGYIDLKTTSLLSLRIMLGISKTECFLMREERREDV